MKLGALKKIIKEDLKGGDLPGWIDGFLYPLNQFMDQVVTALRSKLTFSDNFLCDEVTISLTHNTAQKISPKRNLKIKGILPLNAEGQIVTGWGFTRNDDGSVLFTILFNAAGTTKASTTLEVFY